MRPSRAAGATVLFGNTGVAKSVHRRHEDEDAIEAHSQ